MDKYLIIANGPQEGPHICLALWLAKLGHGCGPHLWDCNNPATDNMTQLFHVFHAPLAITKFGNEAMQL